MLEEALLGPWPWFVTGPLIGLTVPLLFLLGGKGLGISSSFRHMCSIALPRTRIPFLRDNDWRKDAWNLLFVAGIALGGFLGVHVLSREAPDLLPEATAGWGGFAQILLGGFLVGFGSRYAGGCTSGHAITGLSTLQKASLVSVLFFFAGGLAAAGIYVLSNRFGGLPWAH
jgi:uncharacterized membrane protein YedE/YeeE